MDFQENINSSYHLASLILTIVWWYITPSGIGIKIGLVCTCDHFKKIKPVVTWLCNKWCKVILIAVHLSLSLQSFALTQDDLYEVFAFRDIRSLNCFRWAQAYVLLHFDCCRFFFYWRLLQKCFTSLRQGIGILYWHEYVL